jgi:hypothetical protein
MTAVSKLLVGSVLLLVTTGVFAGIGVVILSDDGHSEAEQAHALMANGKRWEDVIEDLSSLPRTSLMCQELTGDLAAPCNAAWVRSSGRMLGSSSGYAFRVTFAGGRVVSATQPEYDD